MHPSFRTIAQRMDPVLPATTLRQLVAQHTGRAGPPSFRDVWERHNGAELLSLRFLFLNTYLMDAKADDLLDWQDLVGSPMTKPRVKARARELGPYLARGWDLVSLAEVWTTDVENDVLAAWDPTPAHADGIAPVMAFSSGLMLISTRLPIVGSELDEYHARAGEDALARKGALRTQLGVPGSDGFIQVYTTHLQAGKRRIALRQVVELATFVHRSRRASEPAIIAGDFNLDAFDESTFETVNVLAQAHDAPDLVRRAVLEHVVEGVPTGVAVTHKTAYRLLTDVMAVLGFRDLWAERNGTPGYTNKILSSAWSSRVCPVDPASPDLCDDAVEDHAALRRDAERCGTAPPKRIDFVFVSEPTAGATVRLDFTRPRRPRHARAADAPGFDEIGFLSDHLGITTTMIVSRARGAE